MLNIQNLTVTFNKGTSFKRCVLEDFTLKAAPGEFIIFMGKNGAGKSTLFNAITGNLQPQKGLIYLNHENCTQWPNYKRSQYVSKVLQDSKMATIPHMSIEENIAFALCRGQLRSLKRFQNQARRTLFQDRLQILGMGLENRLSDPVGNLSGGQRQALSLIMATLAPAQLLLLDEHTAALDPKMADIIMELTEKIVRTTGLTTLMITHNLSYALQYGDRTILLSEGRVLKELSKTEKQNLEPKDLATLFNEI